MEFSFLSKILMAKGGEKVNPAQFSELLKEQYK